jgi:hypothetical protein
MAGSNVSIDDTVVRIDSTAVTIDTAYSASVVRTLIGGETQGITSTSPRPTR